MLRQNNEGIIYGLTYVDHKTKCVFNGSDLGKQYSANGIQERCNQNSTYHTREVSANAPMALRNPKQDPNIARDTSSSKRPVNSLRIWKAER